MQPIQIRSIGNKALTIHFEGEKVVLPAGLKAKMLSYWQRLVEARPRMHNGEVFSVTDVQEKTDGIHIKLSETDYAHYMYDHQIGGLGEHAVRIIHSAALVVTADKKFVFGAMGSHTSRPGVIQCCGGGIDHNDVLDGIVDLEHSTASELGEELGIDPYDELRVASFAPAYLKFGGPKGNMTAVYILRTKQTGDEFMKDYQKFAVGLKAAGEDPEFDEIFCIDSDKKTVDNFTNSHSDRLDEYMDILLKTAAGTKLL